MISIIGSGPVGNYTAYLFAKKGYNVQVFEEHKEIGKPVSCSGILTNQIKKIIKPNDEFLINTCNKIQIFSPSNRSLTFEVKPNFIFNRTKFDQYLANLAKDEGAKIYLKHKFQGIKKDKIKINNKLLNTDLLIGADGPCSTVAKSKNIFNKRNFTIGVQARVKTKCIPNTIKVWLGYGQFSWLIPENENHGRLGVVAYKNAKTKFDSILKKHLPKSKILEWQSGIIPIFNPKQIIQKDNVRLIGDAATQVKATTFGGIYFGMKAAKILTNNINQYSQQVKKDLNKELKIALSMRKVLDKFNQQDFNDLIKFCEKPKVKNILNENERDYPSKIILKLLIAQPKFLKFIKKII